MKPDSASTMGLGAEGASTLITGDFPNGWIFCNSGGASMLDMRLKTSIFNSTFLHSWISHTKRWERDLSSLCRAHELSVSRLR